MEDIYQKQYKTYRNQSAVRLRERNLRKLRQENEQFVQQNQPWFIQMRAQVRAARNQPLDNIVEDDDYEPSQNDNYQDDEEQKLSSEDEEPEVNLQAQRRTKKKEIADKRKGVQEKAKAMRNKYKKKEETKCTLAGRALANCRWH